jgi:hypothetical protein
MFGPHRDQVTGGWRKLHSEELHDLYSSVGMIRVIKWRRLRWAGHVALMGVKRMCVKFQPKRLKGSDALGDLGIDEDIILKCTLK